MRNRLGLLTAEQQDRPSYRDQEDHLSTHHNGPNHPSQDDHDNDTDHEHEHHVQRYRDDEESLISLPPYEVPSETVLHTIRGERSGARAARPKGRIAKCLKLMLMLLIFIIAAIFAKALLVSFLKAYYPPRCNPQGIGHSMENCECTLEEDGVYICRDIYSGVR